MADAAQEAAECGLKGHIISKVDQAGDQLRANDAQRKKDEALARQKGKQPPGTTVKTGRNACGMLNHEWSRCTLKGHPDANRTREPWAETEVGRRYAAAGKSSLKFAENEHGTKVSMGAVKEPKKADKKPWVKKGKSTLRSDAPLLAVICSTDPSYLIAGRLHGTQNITNSNTPLTSMQVKTLIDSGAVQGDYCSRAVGDWVRQHYPECWCAADSEEEITLATEGSSTTSLGTCIVI
jgi:hypothetical protein